MHEDDAEDAKPTEGIGMVSDYSAVHTIRLNNNKNNALSNVRL